MEMKKRALVSVSNKNGVVDFCRGLIENGFEIISTVGTARALNEAGIEVISISDITGFPECLDGRVKTLHPNVYAGLLAVHSNSEHMAQLEMLNINTIDVVCVNLCPFKSTLESGADFAECIENIDIGGQAIIRAAAKNYQDVAVIVDPEDYDKVLEELQNGGVSLETKRYLQYKVFAHTAVYDSLISNYLASQLGIAFPDEVTFAFKKAQDLRYGENTQQQAVFYNEQIIRKGSLSSATQIWGKELSYNNINDANCAIELLKEFGSVPAVVACKHANPCGVGTGENVFEAYMRAYNSDPVSVYGGILAINGTVDEATATEINKIFIEIVIASAYTCGALEILESKNNIRLLQIDEISKGRDISALDMKKVYGGLLVQQYDESLIDGEDINLFRTKASIDTIALADGKQKAVYGNGVVTERAPTEEEIEALLFNWKVVKHTKSNAIVIGKRDRTTGIGMGQTNRIWAVQQAIAHAGGKAKGSVMASDSFFQFSDCVEECVKAGITAIIQPGGSLSDKESIDACNEAGIAMVFVGDSHFKY